MTVAHDAATKSATWTTTPAPFTFDHTPTGTPRGVVVFIALRASTADVISGVTYGGVAMTRVPTNGFAVDTATEAGELYCYTLGASVPTGTQTVSIAYTGSQSKQALCATVTAAADVEVGASGKAEENQANPQVALDTGLTSSLRYVGIFSGLPDPGSLTVLSGMSAIDGEDQGTWTHRWDRQTTASTGSFTIGYTAADDDVAMVAVALQEVAGAVNYDETGRLVTVTSTITVTDSLTYSELALLVSVTATVASTDALSFGEAAAVSIVSTVTATDQVAGTEAVTVTVISTVTGTDIFTGGPQNYDETGRLVSVTATVTGIDQVDWTDALTVTAAGTVTASDILTATDDVAFTIVSTVTGSDILSGAPINYNETGRLVSIVSTVTATDQVDVDENVTVTVVSTVTGSDLLGFSEPVTVSIVSTVTGDDLATLTDNVGFTIVCTVTVTDRLTGPTFWETDPAGYTANPAGYTANPAAYVPVGPSDSPPW